MKREYALAPVKKQSKENFMTENEGEGAEGRSQILKRQLLSSR